MRLLTVRPDNYSNLIIYFWFVLMFKNYAALPQDGVNDILPHKKINPSDSRPGTGMFQWNKIHNIVKEMLSQQVETTTQSHHVNQVNQISNNFHLQQEDSKEDVTPGKQNI